MNAMTFGLDQIRKKNLGIQMGMKYFAVNSF